MYEGTEAFSRAEGREGAAAKYGQDRLLTEWQAVLLSTVLGGLLWSALAWMIWLI
jgi:hypothetical protein